jgi:hypothetical protein
MKYKIEIEAGIGSRTLLLRGESSAGIIVHQRLQDVLETSCEMEKTPGVDREGLIVQPKQSK